MAAETGSRQAMDKIDGVWAFETDLPNFDT